MHFKQILSTTFYLLSSIALIEAKKNDCDKIEDYLVKNVKDYRKICNEENVELIQNCEVNNSGKITEFGILNFMLYEKEVDELLSYNTVTDFSYQHYNIGFSSLDRFKGYPAKINEMTNLEKLTVIDVDSIPKGFAKGSSSKLKYLIINSTNIQQQNIDDISKFTNLKELSFEYCTFDEGLNMSSLKKLKNLTTLEIISGDYDNVKELPRLNNSNVKSLTIKNVLTTQNLIKDIGSFTNLEELYLDDCYLNKDLDYSPLKKLTKLKTLEIDCSIHKKAKIQLPTNIKNLKVDKAFISQNLINAISNITGLKELTLNANKFPDGLNFDSFKKLESLNKLSVVYSSSEYPLKTIPKGFCNIKNLKNLTLFYNGITAIPSEISNLKNLEELYLRFNEISGDLDPLGKLNNLITLDLAQNSIESSLEPLSNLKNLKELYLGSNGNSNSLEPLGKLTKLETLSLYENNFKKIPESFDKLTNLKSINLGENKNLEGKALTLKSLEECDYFYDYYETKVCATKNSNLNCLKSPEKTINPCKDDVKVSTNGKCGAEDGKCPTGKCCSKYGYCGTSEKHCGTGCQSEFGQCGNINGIIPVSTNGKCGEADGRCPNGQCCSKYGYCGTTDKHCDKGCQSEFGQCY